MNIKLYGIFGLAASSCAGLAADAAAQAPQPSPAVQEQTPPSVEKNAASITGTNAPAGIGNWLPEAIAKGKFSLNVRPRWEHAWQQGLTESDAFTVRTRFGYTTAPLYGFQAMIEGENIAAINVNNNYNDLRNAADGGKGRTLIPDAPITELNQAWLSYTNWSTLVRAGRQRIALDNHRFIGDVGWRQNMQTFDSAIVENKSLENMTFFYGYIWDVHRVFGDFDSLPAANSDFRSASHLLHYTFDQWKWLKVGAYTYLLDLENRIEKNPNATASYGFHLTGTVPATQKISLEYRGEFAWQTDYANSPVDYAAPYYNLELGARMAPFTLGAGYEVLGSDNGQGFKTPLATLHAFNGWADQFLNTPGAGLRDIYAFAGVTLPGDVPFRVIVHDFRSDAADIHYGEEIDAVISKKFDQYWTVLAKYAHFDGKSAPTLADVDKFWLQVEFNY